MGTTFTLNGSLGRSDSASERRVLRPLGLASVECAEENSCRYTLRWNAPNSIPDTPFPVTVPFGPVTTAKFIYIHVTNDATIRVLNTNGSV